MKLTIPDFLSHLPVQGGYPVPFFISKKPGDERYDFRYADARKQRLCMEKNLCWVCGKKLATQGGYIISGPQGLSNCVASDTCMHEACARFSLEACPHLVRQSLDRRSDPSEMPALNEATIDPDKPAKILLIRTDKWQLIVASGAPLINYRPKAYQVYHYVEGRLVRESDEWHQVPVTLGWRKPKITTFR